MGTRINGISIVTPKEYINYLKIDMSYHIEAINAFTDNYIWLLYDENSRHALVVDPGDAGVVLNTVHSKQLQLTAVLITHHHYDHIGGLSKLVQHNPQLRIFGPRKESIAHVNVAVGEGDLVEASPSLPKLTAFDVPGHTASHVAYHCDNNLFTGDTLFAAGCGRLLGGTAEQLFQSLQRIVQLDDNTRIYCAHEYTLANLKFAQAVEPANENVVSRLQKIEQMRANGRPSLPSTLAEEKLSNPFLRCDEQSVIQAVQQYSGQQLSNASEVFRAMRSWKDQF